MNRWGLRQRNAAQTYLRGHRSKSHLSLNILVAGFSRSYLICVHKCDAETSFEIKQVDCEGWITYRFDLHHEQLAPDSGGSWKGLSSQSFL